MTGRCALPNGATLFCTSIFNDLSVSAIGSPGNISRALRFDGKIEKVMGKLIERGMRQLMPLGPGAVEGKRKGGEGGAAGTHLAAQ